MGAAIKGKDGRVQRIHDGRQHPTSLYTSVGSVTRASEGVMTLPEGVGHQRLQMRTTQASIALFPLMTGTQGAAHWKTDREEIEHQDGEVRKRKATATNGIPNCLVRILVPAMRGYFPGSKCQHLVIYQHSRCLIQPRASLPFKAW